MLNLLKSSGLFGGVCLLVFLNVCPSPSQTSEYKLGEQTIEGRNHPRVSADHGWHWYRRVGPSVNIRRSTAGQVDMVIQTFTGNQAQCTTSLGEAGGSFTSMVTTKKGDGVSKELSLESGFGKILRHRAVFQSLTPGAYYQYKVECRNPSSPGDFFGNKESVFRVPPMPSDTDETQIAIVSDYIYKSLPEHYGDPDGDPGQAWIDNSALQSKTVSFLKSLMDRRYADFIVLPGDIIQDLRKSRGRPGGTYFGYLTRYHSMHEEIAAGIPMLPVPGNHDVLDGWPCRQANVGKFFKMMATPWSSSTSYNNQWWSLDWGSTHVVGLDLIFDEDDLDRNDQANGCGLSRFQLGSEERTWVRNDLANVQSRPDMKWRVIVQHGSPKKADSVLNDTTYGQYDNFGPCGSGIGYEDYCTDMNRYNVDFILTGHTRRGLRRHLAATSSVEGLVYSYRHNSNSDITHMRLRSDAIVVSRIDVPPETDDGRLMECFKYVPGVRKESAVDTGKPEVCRADQCTIEEYPLKRIIHPGCRTTATTLMTLGDQHPLGTDEDSGAFITPCCKAPHPTDQSKCLDAEGNETSITVMVKVQQCDRKAIEPGCLRRQVLPIVLNIPPDNIPFVTNANLLKECTPCGWVNEGEGKRIAGFEPFCGRPTAGESGVVPVVEHLLNVSP